MPPPAEPAEKKPASRFAGAEAALAREKRKAVAEALAGAEKPPAPAPKELKSAVAAAAEAAKQLASEKLPEDDYMNESFVAPEPEKPPAAQSAHDADSL